jgi:hypothetical protein
LRSGGPDPFILLQPRKTTFRSSMNPRQKSKVRGRLEKGSKVTGVTEETLSPGIVSLNGPAAALGFSRDGDLANIPIMFRRRLRGEAVEGTDTSMLVSVLSQSREGDSCPTHCISCVVHVLQDPKREGSVNCAHTAHHRRGWSASFPTGSAP